MAQHIVRTTGGAVLMASAPVNGRSVGYVILERDHGNPIGVMAPDEARDLAGALLEAAAEADAAMQA